MNPKRKFRVTLTALACVTQVVEVEAEEENQAGDLAVSEAGNGIWKYDGVNNQKIDVECVTPIE